MHEFTLEAWLPVERYEGLYEISDLGRVYSLPRPPGSIGPRRGRLRKLVIGDHGYPVVALYRAGKGELFLVHRLVAAAFIGPCPPGEEVRHRDGVRLHCQAVNLEYGTSGENQLDKIRHGTHHYANRETCGEGHPLSGDNVRIRLAADGSFKQRICLQCRRDRTARITAAKPLLTVTCPRCGTTFEKPQTTGKNRKKYCGEECAEAARLEQTLKSQKRLRVKARQSV